MRPRKSRLEAAVQNADATAVKLIVAVRSKQDSVRSK
jgi:hypothetical protein